MWKIWKYTLGSFNDDKTHKYDDIICVLRTVILTTYVVTNCVICAGVVHHWNDNRDGTLDSSNYVSIVTKSIKK